MTNIAQQQSILILNSFKSDSSEMLDTAPIRKREIADSPVNNLLWFIKGHYIKNIRLRQLFRSLGIYKGSFSKHRTTTNEIGKITLGERLTD